MQFGSVQNHMYARMTIGEPAPEEGMAATILGWSDRYAATIIRLRPVGNRGSTDHVLYVQRDEAKVVKGSGHDGSAEYEYERNPNGAIYHFRKDKKGRWQEVVYNEATERFSFVRGGGAGLRIGERREYRDPSF